MCLNMDFPKAIEKQHVCDHDGPISLVKLTIKEVRLYVCVYIYIEREA